MAHLGHSTPWFLRTLPWTSAMTMLDWVITGVPRFDIGHFWSCGTPPVSVGIWLLRNTIARHAWRLNVLTVCWQLQARREVLAAV